MASRLDFLFPDVQGIHCTILQEQPEVVVFTDCNEGIKQAEKINRFAELTFHERFAECVNEGVFAPAKFREIFPDETLPEESLEGFHFFDKVALNTWLESNPKCPLCSRKIEEILVCPYLTEKFGLRLEDHLRIPPQIEQVTSDHSVAVQPSSMFQDPDSMIKLFLVEMADLLNRGIDPLVNPPRVGLIGWCLERDPEEAKALLEVIKRDQALTYANLLVLKKNPIVGVLKQQIDIYLESLGPRPEQDPGQGVQMQTFIQAFFLDNTNWKFFNSLMEQANITLTYELTDLVMVPPDKRRLIFTPVDLDTMREQARQSQIKRAIVGLIGAAMILFFTFRRIHALFKRSPPIPKT